MSNTVGPVCLVEPQLRRAGTTLGAGETVILMTVNTMPLNNKGNTITLHHEHQVYLYLLRGFTIMGESRLEHGCHHRYPPLFGVYLPGGGDGLIQPLCMDISFRLDVLEQSLEVAQPGIFNTDQGAQFTCADFTGRLESAGVQISMDGRGRALDNVFVERLRRTLKQEERSICTIIRRHERRCRN